jgi:hypothetical protein
MPGTVKTELKVINEIPNFKNRISSNLDIVV